MNTVVTQPRPPANHRRDQLIEEWANATASCLIWIWILKHLPHYIFHYLINYSWNPQTSKGARMPSKHLDSPELDSLFLLHNLQVYESLPRLQVPPKDTQRDGGGGGSREGCGRQRDGVGRTAAEAEGDAERGGRWREMRSGALGKGRRNGGEKKRRGRENADTKRKKGRRQDRGQTELKQPRQPAASVINNVCPVCDRQNWAPAGLRPWICYITATHRKILHLQEKDIVLK